MTLKQFLRPYAALSSITHTFDTDHLDIWIVFKFTMEQTVKPANAKWICEVDEVVKAVTASAWIDAFTMKLTVDAIASIPSVVTIEYDGPDVTLRTTWAKQWEPWGAILSQDSQPLPFGNFKGNEIGWTQAAAQGVWYTISDAGITIDFENKMSFQNNQEFKVDIAGHYSLAYYMTVECSIANKHVLTAPEINGTEQLGGRTHHEFGQANVEQCMSGVSIVLLAVDDLVSINISTPDAGNPTLIVDHIGLTLTQIGLTE